MLPKTLENAIKTEKPCLKIIIRFRLCRAIVRQKSAHKNGEIT